MTKSNSNIPETMDSLIARRVKQYPWVAVRVARNRSASVRELLLLSLFFLAAAHLGVKALFPNPVFWFVGGGAIAVAGTWWLATRKDLFGFLLVLFACVHFGIGESQGGLWSYVSFSVFLVAILWKDGPAIKLSSVPWGTSALLFLFIAHQLLGTILNPYSLTSNIQATVVAFSHVLVFYYCASQPMTASRLKRLLSIWFVIACWAFAMSLNQKYHWVITPSPLLPQRYDVTGGIVTIPAASFSNSELFGEYFCIVFVLSLVIITHLKELARLRIKTIFPLLMVLLSLGAMLMGGSRAAVLLAAAATAYIVFDNIVIASSAGTIRRLFVLLAALLIGGVFILKLGSFLFLDAMVEDFEQLDPSNTTVEAVISGEAINRSTVYAPAYRRLSEKSWWIGYGYNLSGNNRESLGIEGERIVDFHSLYLSLPIFYGWIGATAYVLLVFGAGLRIYLCYLKARRLNHFLVPIALGLAIVWGVFLLDQYKISVTRNPSYFILTWFWLGWTHSVANSMRHQLDHRPDGQHGGLPLPARGT